MLLLPRHEALARHKPSNGTYIYSSSEAFTEEQEFDFLRLYNWLEYFNFRVYGFKMVFEGERPKPKFVRGYHASGHASKSDLMWVIEQIDPDVVIPDIQRMLSGLRRTLRM